MSTKIYNGFRVTGNASLIDLQKRVKEFRSFAQDHMNKKIIKYFGEVCLSLIDRPGVVDLQQEGRSVLSLARDKYLEGCAELRKGFRQPAMDTDCEIVFIPSDAGCLGIIFCEEHELVKTWLATADMEDFSYWNNSDQPDGVTDEMWEARKNAWNQAIPEGVPALSGFAIKVTQEPILPTARQIVAYLQENYPDEVRAQTLAFNGQCDNFLRETLGEERLKNEMDKGRFSVISRLIREFEQSASKESRWANAIERSKQQIIKQLMPLTEETLKSQPSTKSIEAKSSEARRYSLLQLAKDLKSFSNHYDNADSLETKIEKVAVGPCGLLGPRNEVAIRINAAYKDLCTNDGRLIADKITPAECEEIAAQQGAFDTDSLCTGKRLVAMGVEWEGTPTKDDLQNEANDCAEDVHNEIEVAYLLKCLEAGLAYRDRLLTEFPKYFSPDNGGQKKSRKP